MKVVKIDQEEGGVRNKVEEDIKNIRTRSSY